MKQTFLILVSLMMFVSGARAQQVSASCPDRPTDEDAARSLAGQWFSRGAELFKQEKHSEALEAFSCSLRMVAHRATIYNAAQAAIFSGDKKTALILLTRYLSVDPDSEKAEEVKKIMAELESENLQSETPPRVDETVDETEASAEKPPSPEPKAEKSGMGPAPFIVAAGISAALGIGTIVIDSKVGERFDTADKTGEKSDRDDAQSLQTVEKVFFGLTIAGTPFSSHLFYSELKDPNLYCLLPL